MIWSSPLSTHFIIDAIILVSVILSIVSVIMDDRPPSTALAWMLLMVFLPVIGLIIYWVFGRDWSSERRSTWEHKIHDLMGPEMKPTYEAYKPLQAELKKTYEGELPVRVADAIEHLNWAPPLPATSVTMYPSGAETFGRLKDDLREAKSFIHMQYFIWENDELTGDIIEILKERIKAGVEVRIMYDWLGSIVYKKTQLKDLQAAGGLVRADTTQLNSLNYRNHRKISVIDGEIGYTGGLNVGQEYIDGGKAYPSWRDQGLRVTGPIVAELEKWFASRWLEDTDDMLMGDKYLPKIQLELNAADPVMMQIVAHGRDDAWQSAYRAQMIGISGAEKTLRIQSPYFVPDDAIYEAMLNAALAGVDVQFMMTGWPDHKSAFWAAKSFWREFLEAGGRIFLYEKGFFHAKNLAIDSEIAVIGTMNMDIRSLRLQRELMAWIYDNDKALELEATFENDKKECKEVTLADVHAFTFGQRFVYSSSRLAGNIL
jgi:cardiolipin synthase